MNRLILLAFLVTLFHQGIMSLCLAQESAAPGGASVRPPVGTAVIQGVTPGVTSVEELTELWGEPIGETVSGDQIVRLYSKDPLDHIEVKMRGGIVRSIVIELNEPFPERDVRSSLQSELLYSKPVLIPDETGKIIGEIFPEKGVIFLFATQTESRDFLVRQIGIEPITADPFVQRAEAVLFELPAEAKKDLIDAIRLKPDHARALWLLARIELLVGHAESALLYNEKAIQLDEQKPAYHLTFAQALTQMNRVDEAKQYLQETIAICDRFPHERAKALMMLGELYRTSPVPDHEIAYACHTEAIALATALINHNNPTVRLTAKDVLFEAHLTSAKAIAWGNWDQKERAIKQWIDQAKMLARDPELVAAPRYSKEYPFKIASCALMTLVALPEKLNIDLYIDDVIDTGNELIQSTNDPIMRAKYYWDTGVALYDAVQIFYSRKQFSAALKYGELAAEYMSTGVKARNSDIDMFLLGRLCARLGSIHAVAYQNHRAAIEWYDSAKPVYEKLLPKINPGALKLFGDTLVSMGVSYWATDQREEAVRLTERGLRQIERGVHENIIDASELSAPYSNLARMYSDIGDKEQAAKYMRLAASIGGDESRVR